MLNGSSAPGQGAASERSERAEDAPLVKHTERSHSYHYDPSAPVWCERPRKHVVWVSPVDGTIQPVRCESPNKCWYCAMLGAFENALVIKLDAYDGGVWPNMTITTTSARPWTKVTSAEWRRAERSLLTYLRRRFGRQVEWCGFVEWTTGKHARDGQRRTHEHHLVKGLPTLVGCGACHVCRDRPARSGEVAPCALGVLTLDVRSKWRRYTGDAWRVDLAPLRTPAGALAYFALHHNKQEQRPPAAWTGKRFRPTQAYFDRPIPELRERARALIFDERVVRGLVEAWDVPDGFDAGLLDDLLAEHFDDAKDRARAAAPLLHRITGKGELVAVA